MEVAPIKRQQTPKQRPMDGRSAVWRTLQKNVTNETRDDGMMPHIMSIYRRESGRKNRTVENDHSVC